MIFEVDIEKLIDFGISINELLFCQFLYHSVRPLFDFYVEQFDRFYNKEVIDHLMQLGYLAFIKPDKGYLFTNLTTTELFYNHFIHEEEEVKKPNKESVEDWFNDWYNLWPRGIKSGGYPVKGDRKGCLKKLEKFVKEYPEFDKDIIIKATKDYVESCRIKRYEYMKLAHFFIYKDGMSVLAGACELTKDALNNGEFEELKDEFNSSLN